MKRTFIAIVAMLMMTLSVNAQRLTDVTAEARLITDKMVLELGLNNIQRNSILQLNVNYLNGITSYRDIDADGWKYRNKQLKKLLTSKQWKLYKDAYYFYRPISWRNRAYVHNIYAKYPKGGNFKNDKRNKPNFGNGRGNKPHFDKGRREFCNNSPEAIRMRQEMRRGVMKGAR